MVGRAQSWDWAKTDFKQRNAVSSGGGRKSGQKRELTAEMAAGGESFINSRVFSSVKITTKLDTDKREDR